MAQLNYTNYPSRRVPHQELRERTGRIACSNAAFGRAESADPVHLGQENEDVSRHGLLCAVFRRRRDRPNVRPVAKFNLRALDPRATSIGLQENVDTSEPGRWTGRSARWQKN
ncbi:hypothetical protein GCM10023065_15990 [Microbacterium laevaniformans]|nr:hypothetical protein GCM10017578_02690 [Microbacterium laevaniformans]